MAYSQEQMDEVRKVVKQQLQSTGALGVIEKLLSDIRLSQKSDVAPDQAMSVLQEKGLIEQLARNLTAVPRLPSSRQDATINQAVTKAAGKAFLHVKLLGARALIDYVAQPSHPGEKLKLCVECLGHRLESNWADACAEPHFNGELLIPLPVNKPPVKAKQPNTAAQTDSIDFSPEQLLPIRNPLHIVIVSSTPVPRPESSSSHLSNMPHIPGTNPWPDMSHSGGTCRVVAVGAGDWRTALLRTKPVTVSVQVSSGPGVSLGVPAGSAPAGMVTLQLSLHPVQATPLEEGLLQVTQRHEAMRDQQCATTFMQRAKMWWAEYIRKSADFRTRPVKVLARAEDGAQYPACSFVKPLQTGRALATPRHAARFVSLLRLRDIDDMHLLGPGALHSTAAAAAAECWCSLHTVLCSRSGSAEELSLLLCSLLLGFGLDAYVAVGRTRNGSGCMWVITRAAFAETTHWEPATGARYSSLEAANCPFAHVGSVFNHRKFYANCQPDDSACGCSYLLEEPYLWQELETQPSEIPGPGWCNVTFHPPFSASECLELEHSLEQEIKGLLVVHRNMLLGNNGLTSLDSARAALNEPVWDTALEHMLMPALAAYEHEAETGELAPWTSEFQAAVRRATPLGWVFKGVPQHHRHINGAAIAASLAEDPQAKEVLCTAGEESTFALRVKVTAYPQGLCSIWVMLASKSKRSASDPELHQ